MALTDRTDFVFRFRRLSVSAAAIFAVLAGAVSAPAAFAEGPELAESVEAGIDSDVSLEVEDADPADEGEQSEQPAVIELESTVGEGEALLRIDGTLAVIPVEAPRFDRATFGQPGEQPDSDFLYLVFTTTGETVRVTGDIDPVVQTGSHVTGTVTVPAAVLEELSTEQQDAVGQSAQKSVVLDSETSAAVFEASSGLESEFPLASARFEAGVAAANAVKKHTVDVAIVTPAGEATGQILTAAGAKTLFGKLSTYWNGQSNGSISSIAVGTVKTYTSERGTYSGGCSPDGFLWNEALKKFGKYNTPEYYLAQTSSRHLAVFSPTYCEDVVDFSGLASIGSESTSGGVLWVAAQGGANTELTTHEFGHNLSLNHSNVHNCVGGKVVDGAYNSKTNTFSSDCDDYSYMDLYDVMGFSGVNDADTANALNATHKARLGFYRAGELKSVTLPKTGAVGKVKVTLEPASATKGLRGIRITDPKTGEKYYVEYRSGTGLDKNAFYTIDEPLWMPRPYASWLGTGVRVLKVRTDADEDATSKAIDGTSAVLRAPEPAADEPRAIAMIAGESLSGRGGGVNVKVTSIASGKATVEITLKGFGSSVTSIDRIQGDDRYATAANISKYGFTTAKVVYVATGQDYPDALSAAPAAAAKGAPLLLTMTKTLPAVVKAEIKRLKPSQIVVVGGTGAVSKSVENELKKLATVKRIAGKDRFDTSRKVSSEAFPSASAAYLATGFNYPDALSASAAGGAKKAPVILVDGRTGKALDSATAALLKKVKPKSVFIAGGTGAVNSTFEASLTSYTVTRFAGTDRFDTSQKINKHAFPKTERTFLATGMQFPDALAGAALAGKTKAPLYVVMPKCVPDGILKDIHSSGSKKVTLLGGTGALSGTVAKLGRC